MRVNTSADRQISKDAELVVGRHRDDCSYLRGNSLLGIVDRGEDRPELRFQLRIGAFKQSDDALPTPIALFSFTQQWWPIWFKIYRRESSRLAR